MGVKVKLYKFLPSTIEGGEWSASRPRSLCPREIAGLSMQQENSKACLDVTGKDNILTVYEGEGVPRQAEVAQGVPVG